MKIEWNEDTNSFDVSDVKIEQLAELGRGLEFLADVAGVELTMRGLEEFADVVADSLNCMYEPIQEALAELPDDVEAGPCTCYHCQIKAIISIRNAAPLN